MEHVYLLQHSYEKDNQEQTKIIGIYLSLEIAISIVEKYKLLPGFKDYPDCFHIDKYLINENNWTEGFIKWSDASCDI